MLQPVCVASPCLLLWSVVVSGNLELETGERHIYQGLRRFSGFKMELERTRRYHDRY